MSLQPVIDELREYLDKPPAYTAVVLDELSTARLRRWWKEEIGPLLPLIRAHHMTIEYAPTKADMRETPIGKKTTLQVVGWAQDNSVQVVVVRSPVKSQSRTPHVTVAKSGGSSSQSNALLALGFTRVRGPKLTGTVLGQERGAAEKAP